MKSLHECIETYIKETRHALVLNVNVNALNLSCENPWMRHFLNQGDIVFCDGFGVILGSRILGRSIPQRITYADWLWEFSEFAQAKEMTFFFLGGRPGVAEKAADKLKERFPRLQIDGIHHGYFDKAPGCQENEAVIRRINKISPNVLLVAFGMPLQERWLMENWPNLDAGIALTGGAVFDYISGDLRRAPRWMTEYGLEWLGRLMIEPSRLWRRYLLGNPLFLWRIFKQRLGIMTFKQ
ncbi:WecB/TagA/CpsF family glycosyltransferase [Acidobacteriota bacterium]